jgi:UPF0755 protein
MGERKNHRRIWLRLLLIFIIITICWAGIGFYWLFLRPNYSTLASEEPVEIKIRSGTEFYQIADSLYQNKIIENHVSFEWAARLSQTMNCLRAGKYLIPHGLSNWQVIKLLAEGKVPLERITIPEGKTFEYYASILQKKIEIDSARFAELVHDSAYVHRLGIQAPTLNGYLYPDTYFFSWGMSEKQCIEVMVRQFFEVFPDTIKDRDPELGFTHHQMVILASLIEGEVQLDGEHEIVSALFRNRLKRGMLLQSCPTIQYIIPDGPRRLLNRDLEIDSPYNTYIYPGLPPGPINNPGKKSLMAAANPEDVPFLYMVARGDGGHTFSRTLSGHLNAKRIFDIYRRQVNREKRRNKAQ